MPDNAQIHVAVRTLLALCDRSEDKGRFDAGEMHEPLPDQIGDPGSLARHALQLGKDRALGIRLKHAPVPITALQRDAGQGERVHFLADHRRGNARQARQLTQVNLALWVGEQHPERRLPGLPKQRVRQ